jgi:protein-S-isoprenylcysteine O-methyltransferase Ste14
MNGEIVFRVIIFASFLALTAIRIYYQKQVLTDNRKIDFKEGPVSLTAGSIAALTTIVFGVEYIFFRGVFGFAYPLLFPAWLRWSGVVLLAGGILLLQQVHHHLGKSFHSLVVSKEDHQLVQTGPYQYIRHPMYTAYLMNYVAGGLISSNIVLAVVPPLMYAVLVAIRLKEEEEVMIGEFGEEYVEYRKHTGALLPKIGAR